jgi:hypothetical protein
MITRIISRFVSRKKPFQIIKKLCKVLKSFQKLHLKIWSDLFKTRMETECKSSNFLQFQENYRFDSYLYYLSNHFFWTFTIFWKELCTPMNTIRAVNNFLFLVNVFDDIFWNHQRILKNLISHSHISVVIEFENKNWNRFNHYNCKNTVSELHTNEKKLDQKSLSCFWDFMQWKWLLKQITKNKSFNELSNSIDKLLPKFDHLSMFLRNISFYDEIETKTVFSFCLLEQRSFLLRRPDIYQKSHYQYHHYSEKCRHNQLQSKMHIQERNWFGFHFPAIFGAGLIAPWADSAFAGLIRS